MVAEIELFECGVCLWGWMRTKFTKERWIHETNCSLVFLDVATRINEREDQLRRTKSGSSHMSYKFR